MATTPLGRATPDAATRVDQGGDTAGRCGRRDGPYPGTVATSRSGALEQ
jgi:hypothetical protein